MSTKNTSTEFNEHLFEVLRGLKARRVKPDQARALSSIAGRIISNAKLSLQAEQAKKAPSFGFFKMNGAKRAK